MYWRVARGGRTWDEMRGDAARNEFRDLVTTGVAYGVLAFLGDTPVGWACVGPHKNFPRLDTVRAFRHVRAAKTWSIVCFYIPSKYRRSGIATQLLIAARDLAYASGAAVVEGYPVTVKSKRGLPGAFAWTGVPAMFRKAGFRPLGDPDQSRHIWVSSKALRSRGNVRQSRDRRRHL
jgi:GNAT superfamily N-acetyltransferase